MQTMWTTLQLNHQKQNWILCWKEQKTEDAKSSPSFPSIWLQVAKLSICTSNWL